MMRKKAKAGCSTRKKAKSGTKMKKAKSGKKVKKAGYGKSMKAKSGTKVKKAQAGAAAKALKAFKKAKLAGEVRRLKGKKPKLPKGMSKVIKQSTIDDFLKGLPKGKSGLKTPKASQKGLKKLPTAVRNKMGYAKKGKTVKKAGYGKMTKKAKSGCSTRRRKKK